LANSNQIRKKQLRVGDIINNKQMKLWQQGDIITISAGTGKGKSFFIKNTLFAYAKEEDKKILMLIHRSDCVKQFQEEIKRDGKEKYIDIMTYQSIESKELSHNDLDMNQYKYIVCDEFHYFLSDAGFNNTTDVSFENIMKQNHATRIFMSATGDDMKRYMNNILNIKTVDYEIPLDFSFIEYLTFYNKDITLEYFAEQAVKKNQKVIFFIQSAVKAYKLFKKYEKYALFNCSKSNDKHYKHVDIDKINNMLKNEKFDDLILITTSCLDAGVNINDKELKHVVIDIKDTGSLIQCIGRKRIQGDENINVYIKTINNQQLGGMESRAKKDIQMSDFLNSHNTKEYLDKYKKAYDNSHIIYDDYSVIDGKINNDNCVKKVNRLMYFKKKIDIVDYQTMKQWGEFGYCKFLAFKFGFYDEASDRFTYRTIKEDNSLEDYLENMVDKVILQSKDRKELIEKINIRHNGKLIKKLDSINPTLSGELGYQYRIREFSTSRIVDGIKKNFKNAWVIERIQLNE
jgi:hypothetical protein